LLCVLRTLRRAGDESLQSRRIGAEGGKHVLPEYRAHERTHAFNLLRHDAACVELGLMTKEEADELVDPLLMAEPEKMAPIVAAFKEKLGILI
jgi:hypothetical protein